MFLVSSPRSVGVVCFSVHSLVLKMFPLLQKDAPSPGADLEDMQSVLFLLEDADAYRRNGNLAMALKRYTSIQKLFNEFEDDQFDFHGYSLRKFTINIYLRCVDSSIRPRASS